MSATRLIPGRFDAEEVAADLRRDGYCVIDDAVSPEDCATLTAEYEALHDSGLFEISGNVVENNILTKRGVAELDFMVHRERKVSEHVLAMCPRMAGLLDPSQGHLLMPDLQAALPSVQVCALDQLKVQRAEMPPAGSPPTGCFPMHFDTSETFETRRTVTVLLYLSDEDVSGGALEVFPFPGGRTRAVEPKAGRVVIFGSFFLYHRTRPLTPCAEGTSPAIRRALSLWFASEEKSDAIISRCLLPRMPLDPSPTLVAALDGDEARARKAILTANTHQNLRLLTKLWLETEIDESFREAYKAPPGQEGKPAEEGKLTPDQSLAVALKRHHMTVDKVRELVPADVVRAIALRLIPPPPSQEG